MMEKLNYEKYYPYMALFVMVVLGGFLMYGLSMFLNPILGAFIMYILTRPILIWFTEKRKWNNTVATITVLLLSFLILLLPVIGITYLLVQKIVLLMGNTDALLAFFDKIKYFITQKIQFNILSEDTITSLKSVVTREASSLLNQTFTIVTDIGMMYFILYFMLSSRKRMEDTISFYLPYKPENISEFKKELKAQTYSNAIVTPLLAFIQGTIASVGYWIFGVDEAIFWGLMTGVFSFMPLIGSMVIWVPLSIYMLASGETGNGIGIIIYSVAVVSNIDNVCRFMFQKKFADVHPLITLLGFLFGIKYFGISGIIIGPVLMSFFLIMIKNFRKEFMESKEEALDKQ